MNKRITLMTALVTALTACGGGGDESAPEIGGQLPSTATAITVDNAADISSASYRVAIQTTDNGMLGTLLPVGVEVTEVSEADAGLLDATILLMKNRPESNLVVGAETETYECAGGGSVTYSGTETAFTVTANSCSEEGYTVNGAASIQLTSETATGFAATVSFNNFSVTHASSVAQANGAMTVLYNEEGFDNVTLQVSSSSLRMYVAQGSSDWTAEMKNYSASHVRTGTQNSASADFSYAVAGTDVPAFAASVDTTAPFVTHNAQLYPQSGRMVITGTKSSVVLSVVDSTNVRLEVDTNGDGAVDETIDTTWAKLLAS